MKRPESTEYNPGYQKYIDLVGEGSFEDLLNANTNKVVDFFRSIDKHKHNHRYEKNKWTIKDVFMHMIDTERGFSFRALVCVRSDDRIPLYALDEDFYASNVDVTERSMEDLIEEFLAVRKSFGFIFTNMEDQNLEFLGNGIEHKISARALGYIAIGHAMHHLNIIKERYL
ncbi:DinB family protein [Fulvivirgaceae bacterium BMA10]|uniref:DinB family protein n=1 Tax=Splendidivirga corallicola TaxID=3051826 RepID=A0ABT8KQS7_9BACT|nr:DinB family protein [Fulvivirgaceae bacterium BMA10]